MNKNAAIVLGLCPNGLGVVRSLGRNGLPVFGYDYKPDGPGFYSKYARTGLCPNPYQEPDSLCEFLLRTGRNLKEKGLIFPTSDEFVLFVSRYRKKLSDCFLFSLPSENVIESLLNKRWQYEMAEITGVPYPQTFYPDKIEDIKYIREAIKYPAIIKPCYTHLWKDKGFKVKGFKVGNGVELENRLLMLIEKEVSVIVQSIIPGPVDNFFEVCSYLDKNGKPLCVFIKKKLRQYPMEMGLGSYMESVKNSTLSKLALDLISKIGYQGPIEVEFKKDCRDGHFKVIEINARLTLQNSLAEYCGISLPLIQYRDLLHTEKTVKIEYKTGIKWVWSEIDFEAFKEMRKSSKITLIGWIKSIMEAKSYAIFSLVDIYPFFNIIIKKFKRLYNIKFFAHR